MPEHGRRRPQHPGPDVAEVLASFIRFIRAHRGAGDADELVIATGYVSAWGLGWLAENTTGPVTVIVGDLKPHRFQKGTDDGRKAVELLERSGSRVFCWYRTRPKEAIAHGKAVVFRREGKTVAALAGSANLTRNGLNTYAEIMVPVDPAGFAQIDRYVDQAISGGREAKKRLIRMCGAEPPLDAASTAPSPVDAELAEPPPDTGPRPKTAEPDTGPRPKTAEPPPEAAEPADPPPESEPPPEAESAGPATGPQPKTAPASALAALLEAGAAAARRAAARMR